MRMITIGLDDTKVTQIPMCACIGYFDGMHRGHQELIKRTVQMAEQMNSETAMITFEPDPWVTIKGMRPQDVKHITTMRQRINKAVSFGIQNIVVLKFDKPMSQLAPADFIDKVLGKLNLKGLVCGFDFHFGAMGKGDNDFLMRYAPYPVEVVPEVDDGDGKISSSRISQCIQDGEMEETKELLGFYYSIEGVTVHGNHVGTELGFPTANISYSSEYLLPLPGVYACYAHINQKCCKAMVNLGHNPTLNYCQDLSLEAHILDYDEDLYGVRICLDFVKFLRPEMKFRSRDNLIMQLEQDVRNVRDLLKDDE